MTDEQNNKLRMYNTVETVLDAHPDPLAGIPAAQTAITDFKAALQSLRDATQGQTTYAPQGKAKETLRSDLAAAAVPVSQTVAAWAEDNGDVALADQIAFTRTDFIHGREQDALDRALLVHTTADDNAAALADYGLTPTMLTDLDGHIDAFSDALTTPRHAIAERMVHTAAIETLIPQIDRILTRRLDRFVAQFDGTPFYTEYHAARTIIDN